MTEADAGEKTATRSTDEDKTRRSRSFRANTRTPSLPADTNTVFGRTAGASFERATSAYQHPPLPAQSCGAPPLHQQKHTARATAPPALSGGGSRDRGMSVPPPGHPRFPGRPRRPSSSPSNLFSDLLVLCVHLLVVAGLSSVETRSTTAAASTPSPSGPSPGVLVPGGRGHAQ